MRKTLTLCVLIGILALSCKQGLPVVAQSTEPATPALASEDGLHIEETSDGVTLAWSGHVQAGPNAPMIEDASGQWRTIEIGDRLLPAQLVSVVVEDSARIVEGKGNPKSLKQSFASAALVVESAPWAANLPFVNIPIPQSATGEKYPDLARKPNPALPNAPVIVLREGYVRNLHLAVLAVTPIYGQDGVARAASRINATVRGVRLLKDQNEILGQFDVNGAGREPLRNLTQSTQPNGNNAPDVVPVPGPTVWPNPNAVYKIAVAQTGMQVVNFTSLPSAPSGLASANWNVRYNDQVLAIIMADVNGNTQFDSGDYIKFYAPYVGDRLNKTTTYWLSYDNTAITGGRIASVSKPVTNATASTFALERRQWMTRTLYTSLFAGEDGDHFFAGSVKASSPIPITVPPIAFTLDGVLPPAGGNLSVTLVGVGTTGAGHNGEFTLNGVTKQVTWSGSGAIPASAGTFAITSPPQLSPSGAFYVKAQVGTALDEVLLEAVKWERPVTLNFGSKGAVFHTRTDGSFAYQLTNLPTFAFFLDITAPLTPAIMTKDGAATTYQFQDGPGHVYLMEGAGQTWTPTVSKHTPSAWTNLNKTVLYIAPANLQASLGPLLNLRTTQGYQPLAVTPDSIYDAWGYGQISSQAIRNFLRYAASAWAVPPIAVTFVGTSTYDPFNYLGDYGQNQFVIPAYLGPVDPFIGETACDTCYAALDEDEAIFSDDKAAIFPDLLFGRLPVKTAAELDTMVTKIVGHDTAAFGSALNTWRSRIGLISDNYQFEDGHTDGAGNFAAFSEVSAKLHPLTIRPTRAYFDLCKSHTIDSLHPACDLQKNGFAGQTTAETMRQAVVNMYNAGQSLIVYNGHGNQVQIGDEKFMEAIDVPKLTNATMLPIVMEMTCYTSQFVNNYYQTLDEALVLKANGGAIAVWGATGLGVAHGHDALQSGFLKALWKPTSTGKTGKATVGIAPVGELTLMGYTELALNGGCCQDTIRTFLVLGDPLTSLRMQAPKGMYLPYVRKP